MGNRTIERSMARTLYQEFSRRWRRERRIAGKQGDPKYRRPTFRQWHQMHLRDLEMMRQSTPVDVQEYMGQDPWVETPEGPPNNGDTEPVERGVLTLPMSGDPE